MGDLTVGSVAEKTADVKAEWKAARKDALQAV